jgi:hypothetical protein
MNPGRCVSLIAMALICGASARAQSSGYIHGHVLDPSIAAISGAAVTVVNEDTGFRRNTESQADGSYAVGSLVPGFYKVTVQKSGFRTMIRFHVRLEQTQAARADFALALGSMQETITVEGAAPPMIERNDASVATVIARNDIEKLPLNGRGLLGLLDLAPGTDVVPATRGDAGQFVADGQRPNANYFTVDGISANNGVSAGGLPAQAAGGSLPVLSAFGSLDSLISLDAAQEVRIQTSTGAAEFGRLPGASVSIASRSGTDEFHGSAAYSFRHELLGANDWFANRAGESRVPLREHNGAVTFGGPVIRHRTFFFLSFERMALRQPFTWLDPVPTLEARGSAPAWAQPALDLFPQPNGPPLAEGLAAWNGRNSRLGLLYAGSIRIDHALTRRITLFGRYSDSPSSNEFGSTQVNHLDFRSWSGTLGVNWRVGPEAVVDFRVNQSVTSAHSVWSGPAGCELQPLAAHFLPGGTVPSCDLLVRFSIGGIGQLVSGPEGGRRQKQFQLVQSAAWQHGAHALRLGVDFRRIVPVRRDASDTVSLIASSLSVLDDKGSIWVATSPAQSVLIQVQELSAWAHDTWKIGPHLTLIAGLRWEYSPAPAPANVHFFNPATGTIQTDTRPLWLKPYGHFAPRLGIAFSPGKSGRTVFRAGGGLYYDSSLSIATDVINSGPMNISQFSRQIGFTSGILSFGIMPNLTLPRVAQWNFSVEHSLSARDTVSISYVGAAGRQLIRREVGGLGNSPTAWVALTTNRASSDYHSLAAQYRRRVARGLEALLSYAWSHSLDDASSDSFLVWAGASAGSAVDRGSSDFDLRHSLAASFSYALPGVVRGWSVDGMFRARSGFPITVLQAEQYIGINFSNAFRPDLVANVPLWIADQAAPSGRVLNSLAFSATDAGRQGSLGRNALSGFGMSQLDVAVRREFRVADRRAIELRIEAFNALNHANFADPVKYLNSPFFGQSTSMLNMMLGTGSPGSGLAPMLQAGGARSVEAVLRFRF